jgi:hypothetical protein
MVAALIGAIVLVADLYVHEAPECIEFHVQRAVRASVGAAHVPAAPPPTPPLPQTPLLLGFRPLMLLGPTGCGKSAALARATREAASSRTPCVLVRWRLPESARRETAAGARAPAAEAPLLTVSKALFQQIGYPLRRAWVVSLLSSGVVAVGLWTQEDMESLALLEARDRLLHALRVLFRAAAQVQGERAAAGVPALDAAPVLLFDDVLDLVQDERLAGAGGGLVFKILALLLIGYCVDRQAGSARRGGGQLWRAGRCPSRRGALQ